MIEKNIEEEIKQIINDYVSGKICDCGGGGYDYYKEEECKICNGSGIYDWNFDVVIPKIKTLLQKSKQQWKKELLDKLPDEKIKSEKCRACGGSGTTSDCCSGVDWKFKDGYNTAIREIKHIIKNS